MLRGLLKANFPMRATHKRAAVATVAAVLCFACHPARQLQKQDTDIQSLKAKWIGDWVVTHPCPQLPPVDLDSLCALRTGNDFAFGMNDADTVRDTTRLRDTLKLSGGVKRILVPYEDRRVIELLHDSLRAKTEYIAMLEGKSAGEDLSSQLTAAHRTSKTWLWAFIAACVVIVAGLGWKVYSFFRNPIKSIV